MQEVIDQSLTDCDDSLLPDGVSTSSTFCIDQGRSGQLGTSYKIEPGIEIEIGGGWPNAIWGKLTGKAIIPPVVPVGPVPVPLPNEIHAGGDISLGRGLSICVDVPITALDSFDIADAAIDRLIDGEFVQSKNGLMLFQDPVFQDLIGALDVPVPAIDTINDPDRILGIFNTIGQSNIANTCQTMGITSESKARFPALANQCARFGIYPNISRSLNAANTLVNVQSSLSSLRNWMCDNISLGLFTSC